jgi:hypothetical protein
MNLKAKLRPLNWQTDIEQYEYDVFINGNPPSIGKCRIKIKNNKCFTHVSLPDDININLYFYPIIREIRDGIFYLQNISLFEHKLPVARVKKLSELITLFF